MALFRLLLPVLLCGIAYSVAAGATRSLAFNADTVQEACQWQTAAREKVFALMMGGERPDSVPLDPTVVRRIEVPEGGYFLEEITIQTLPDRRAHAWVAIPESARGKLPAVLVLHGHGGSGEQVVLGHGIYWYGRALAEMGYAVIAPDIGSHELQYEDWTLMGERVWDAICCIDYILGRPEVARKGVGLAGLSLGGETAMYRLSCDLEVPSCLAHLACPFSVQYHPSTKERDLLYTRHAG